MEREILFRGFHLDNNGDTTIYVDGAAVVGRWVEGDLTQDRDLGTAYIQGFNYYASDGLQREPFGCEVIPETIGQYTGLPDKNREKIFENDVVYCWDANSGADFIAIVKFGNPNYTYSMGVSATTCHMEISAPKTVSKLGYFVMG